MKGKGSEVGAHKTNPTAKGMVQTIMVYPKYNLYRKYSPLYTHGPPGLRGTVERTVDTEIFPRARIRVLTASRAAILAKFRHSNWKDEQQASMKPACKGKKVAV